MLGTTDPEGAKAPQVTRHTLREEMRLLLAEDNMVNQKIAVSILEKRGHRVVVAGNGVEALPMH